MSPQKTGQVKPGNFIKETKAELSKVTWPTREEATRYTIIVIVSAIISGLLIGAVDFVLARGLEVLL